MPKTQNQKPNFHKQVRSVDFICLLEWIRRDTKKDQRPITKKLTKQGSIQIDTGLHFPVR